MQVDRQTLFFFIIMFIFLTLPNGNEQPHSTKEKDTLVAFQQELRNSQKELASSEYGTGYGNITGFRLSYQDLLDGKNETKWPFHRYDDDHRWQEIPQYSILPKEVSDDVKEFWGVNDVEKEDEPNPKAFLLNISGQAYGEFKKEKTELKKYNLHLPQYLQEYYDSYNQGNRDLNRYEGEDPDSTLPPDIIGDSKEEPSKVGNITKNSGKISIEITNLDYNFRQPDLAKFIQDGEKDKVNDTVVVSLGLIFKDYNEIERHDFDTRGVYFQETGAIITVTRSAKFLGNYGISHLTMNEANFNRTRTLMNQYLNFTDLERDFNMDDMNGYILKSEQQCELISYFQLERTEYSKDELRLIDEELMNPSGKPIPEQLPFLSIKEFLIYSPDCGLVFKSKPGTEFVGLKSEVYHNRLRHLLTGILVLVIIQLILFLRQIKETRTPGQLSTISSKSLFIIGFQDSLMALMFLLFSTFMEDLYLILACVSVVTFIMCGIFELRFIVSVLSTQVNERGTTWWEILRGASAESVPADGQAILPDTNTEGNANEPLIPLTNPPPAPAPTPNVNQPNQAWEESSFSNSVFASGFSLTIVATFLILNSFIWRIKYRRIFEYVGLFLVNSYWIPQFFRNTLKNRRKSFSWEFIIGTSTIRLLPIFYFCLVKSNPLRHHYDPILVAVITNWVVFQILLLILQQQMGARFWVNEKWLPKAYDYQRILHIKDLEHGFSSDLLANIKPNESGSEGEEDRGVIECKCTCPICMSDISLPILTKEGDDSKRKKINNRLYMITPCHHIFHSECLEDWMKYKLQCPVCRESLPPV
ncbi:uncharacterized protein RJT20DRAFT_31048 [Scheffersomyces xylosifermentans]|uniref:uncharacterized protein n=1 Tax=Scheffersomyces xylosifermentans TaxID=1304137 RepID=UPI00315C89A5